MNNSGIGDRIKEIRKVEKLTQQKFADRIGAKQNTIAQYEIGRNVPIDPVINSICKEFGISEDWLRYGLEPMKPERTRSEEIASRVENALNGSSEFKKAVIQAICSRTDEELEALDNLLRDIYDNLPKPEDDVKAISISPG